MISYVQVHQGESLRASISTLSILLHPTFVRVMQRKPNGASTAEACSVVRRLTNCSLTSQRALPDTFNTKAHEFDAVDFNVDLFGLGLDRYLSLVGCGK